MIILQHNQYKCAKGMSKSVKEIAIRLLSLFIHVFLEVVSYGMFILLLSNSIRTTWQIYQPIERSKLFYQVVWWFPAAAILYEYINLLGWNDHELLYTSLQTSLWWLYTPACVGLNQWWMIDKSVRPFLGFVKTEESTKYQSQKRTSPVVYP